MSETTERRGTVRMPHHIEQELIRFRAGKGQAVR
jgi:hypothetical protein